MGNDKHSILEALISLNDDVWGKFHMHPLKTNMRLATAAAARAKEVSFCKMKRSSYSTQIC